MLNPEQIAAMTAGREMDAAVHNALGHGDDCSGPMIMVEPDGDGGVWPACTVCEYQGWDTPTHKAVVPRYSEEIGAAWLVVEKMRADGYAFDAGSWENMGDGNNWIAAFEHCSAPLPVRGLGATMPEAICKASLACRAALAMPKGEGDG